MQQRRQQTQRRRMVSRRYTSSFSGIDWGRSSRPDICAGDDDDIFINSLLNENSRQEFTKEQGDNGALISLNEAGELRNTGVSQESHGQETEKGGHSAPRRLSFLTKLHSWRGSLLEIIGPRSDDSAKDDDDMMDDGDMMCTAAKEEQEPQQSFGNEQKQTNLQPLIRRCSSQLDESDVDGDGFLHWNDTQPSSLTQSFSKLNQPAATTTTTATDTTSFTSVRGESFGSSLEDAQGFLHWDGTIRK